MSQITKIAWDLNKKTNNRYQLVYELIELAKKLVDESQMKKSKDDFGYDFEMSFDPAIKKRKTCTTCNYVESFRIRRQRSCRLIFYEGNP